MCNYEHMCFQRARNTVYVVSIRISAKMNSRSTFPLLYRLGYYKYNKKKQLLGCVSNTIKDATYKTNQIVHHYLHTKVHYFHEYKSLQLFSFLMTCAMSYRLHDIQENHFYCVCYKMCTKNSDTYH